MTLSNLERYERIAWVYDLLDLPFEYGRYRKIRPLLFRRLSGRILEAGVGTGRNFPFYPPGSEVVGIDLSPAMLARAERRLPMAAAKVELLKMDVTRLSFSDGSFDAAVATFLFCTLPDELQVAGMRELGRVVKPGGIIRCLEYTRPSGGLRRAMTRLWEPWVYWAYGAGFDRKTEQHVPEAGLQLLESRFVADELLKLLGGSGPMISNSVITCPKCGYQAAEEMPTDACQIVYECRGCASQLKPKPGDCCVFCSYGSVPCPPIQAIQRRYG